MQKDIPLLRKAYRAWCAADTFRRNRERYKRYTYGDQWCDTVTDRDGTPMTEYDLLVSLGRRPMTNNLLRQLIKTIVGRYRNEAAENRRYDTAAGSAHLLNDMPEMDARMLEEFIISGCAVQRVAPERRIGGTGVWVDNVDPRTFFVNRHSDPRGLDIDLIGMFHDYAPDEVVARFGGHSARRADELEQLYRAPDNIFSAADGFGADTSAAVAFFAAPAGRWRVYEVWSLESNTRRSRGGHIETTFTWRCRHLAPDGTVVARYDSPYAHRSHPFALKLYPLIDGEVHSFVEDLIDTQRTINRLVVTIDTMMSTAAKGTLLFPVKRIAPGMSINDVARLWSAPDSVIPIGSGQGEMPTQVVTNTADSGAYQALSLQMRLLSEISGMSDAMMGRNTSGAAGSALYEAQVRQSATGLADLLATFDSFTRLRDDKIVTADIPAPRS